MSGGAGESLLCVVHFPANTGFAWNYIEGLYADVADALAKTGIQTFVAYPRIDQPPKPLNGSSAQPIVLDASLDNWASIKATIGVIRRRKVRTVYFTDRGWSHWSFPLLRLAGVRRIVAHDHTSGARTVPRGVKQLVKWVKARIPGTVADRIVTVSDYVARRQREVGMMSPNRVVRIWNGIELPALNGASREAPIPEITPDRLLVLCVCRAAPEKGVDHLLRAFDRVIAQWPAGEPHPLLVYVGNGPVFDELRALRESLPARNDIVLTGYRTDVPRFIERADLCVVPSVWQDACPLGVLEPMSHAKPVVASRVGGVPEQIDSPAVGALVEPGDPESLARTLIELLRDPARRAAIGVAARDRIARHFNRGVQMATLVGEVRGK